MTKAWSHPLDNGGRCESCNRPETEWMTQQTYPVYMGPEMGWGTMWLCLKCLEEHKLRDKGLSAVDCRILRKGLVPYGGL